ncbi:MAG: hypothetical protein AB7E32_16970 [Desulfovibrio sp.]
MQTLHTRYGLIPVQGIQEWYPDGSPRSCIPAGPVELSTPLGGFIPQHSTDDLRRKEVQPLCFYANGQLQYLPLETATPVTTPAGRIKAELLTFHKQGALKRAFPLNGRLSGYWSQEDEQSLAESVELELPWGRESLKPLSVCFDAQGRWRSLTLWPGEILNVPTRLGQFAARVGVSFWDHGAVRSLEPATPQPLATPVGDIWAFDPDAVGISGDRNSLEFDRKGRVVRLRTTQSILGVDFADGSGMGFAPRERESLCGNSEREIIPMELEFLEREVLIRQTPEGSAERVPYAGSVFRVHRTLPKLQPLELRMGCTL